MVAYYAKLHNQFNFDNPKGFFTATDNEFVAQRGVENHPSVIPWRGPVCEGLWDRCLEFHSFLPFLPAIWVKQDVQDLMTGVNKWNMPKHCNSGYLDTEG